MEWIKCSERMPESGITVLGYCVCNSNFSGIYTMRKPVIEAKNSKQDTRLIKHERVT
ncbi:DUF551 domain-containing protein, partial [Salmonella enterica]|nr:DUF551 domain-containing protein [Salmonella enterica]ECI2936719.1 DUF551 domain-containing protein [Salmonella enterica subsp. enterica serovar Heidelberg]EAQ2693931.1 DUF551 domain-containing protein [Salmonella enterica]EAS7156629.1 DUF551 domain-containing protein [Salmonella enterica]EAU1369548.1 DUF551 domain-containing protein [Salmonella enterica]